MDTQLSRYNVFREHATLPPIPRLMPVSGERVAPHAGADAHPCAFNHRALPAKVSAIQACLASGGGWGRLTLTVRPLT
jgi:hypothetical protein